MKLKQPQWFSQGYHLLSFSIRSGVKAWVHSEKWEEVDAHFKTLTSPKGEVFLFLSQFYVFSSIEFIISIRDAQNEWEEDGIWHDDGTRVFAFSLSLTESAHDIRGGFLEFRRKNEEAILARVPTPEYGQMILFLTGMHGYEHRTRQVLKGKRVVIAGWCSE